MGRFIYTLEHHLDNPKIVRVYVPIMLLYYIDITIPPTTIILTRIVLHAFCSGKLFRYWECNKK